MRVDAREGKIRQLEKEKKPFQDQLKRQEELIEEHKKIQDTFQNEKMNLEE